MRVFLDVNMMKYAVDEVPRLVPELQRIHWGDIEQDVTIHRPVVAKLRDALDAKLASETALLPLIALLARLHRLELLWHIEAEIESWGLKEMHDLRGRFYGAPITRIPGPVRYSRIVVGGHLGAFPRIPTTKPLRPHKHLQVAFIAGLTDPRLLDLRRACGADKQGGVDANQIIDAFHLWCAETSGATHFLTAEKKLLGLAGDATLNLKARPVLPSQLVAAVLPSALHRLYYRARLAVDVWRHPRRWHVAA